MESPQGDRKLLTAWARRARHQQHAHYEAGDYYNRRHKWLGIPTVGLTAIVGTTLFASLRDIEVVSPLIGVVLQVVLGLLSLLATVLVSFQTFLGYSQLAAEHKLAGAQFGSIRREIDQLLARKNNTFDAQELTHIRQRLDEASKQFPNVPDSVWDRTKNELKDDPYEPQ